MLIVHPNSTCDVCLEGYGRGVKAPHSIACGHVFCLNCLESISSGACPLCRERFHPLETRRLHVDTDASATPIIGPPIDMSESSHEARKLQDSIARVVKDGSSESHLRHLIEDCSNFLRTQPRNMYEELRLSHRMISYLCDIKSKLKKQTETYSQLAEAKAELESQSESLRGQLAVEQEAVDASNRRYRDLLQTSRDEKETALAVERSLRSHYEDIARRYSQLESDYKALKETVGSSRRNDGESRHTNGSTGRPVSLKMSKDNLKSPNVNRHQAAKSGSLQEPMVVDKEEMILSPLPEDIRPLTTSINGFTALPEVEFEEKDVDMKSVRSLNLHTCSDENAKRTSDDPFPNDTHHRGAEPIQINPPWTPGLPRSSPRLYDSWDITRRSSKSRNSSRPGSRSRSHSRNRSHPASPSILSRTLSSPRQSSRGRFGAQDESTRDSSSSRERRVINEPEELQSHLYEILTDPISSSLPKSTHMPSGDSSISNEIEPPSRSGSASSNRSIPLPVPPPSNTPHSTILSSSPVPLKLKDASSGSRPVMSHASIAALALEKERQRIEKERLKAEKERSKEERDRQKERDRERRRSAQANSTSGLRRDGGFLIPDMSVKRTASMVYSSFDSLTTGLRDSTNSHSPRHQPSGTGKSKGHSLLNLYA